MILYEKYRLTFLERTKKTETCWLWIGDKTDGGYGRITIKGKKVRAHRLSYCLYKGDPGDKLVLHTCDTPPCVNPEHLFLGTDLDNTLDKMAKGRGPNMKREKHPQALLSESIVLTIFEDLKTMTQREVSVKHGISISLVSAVKTKRRWS